MQVEVPFRSFAAGEVSPTLGARVDQVKYRTGLETCRNWITCPEGMVENRNGFAFLSPLLAFTNTVPRLLQFIFNDDQAYVIALHRALLYCYALVLKNGFPILEDAKTISGATNADPCVITSTAHGYSTDDLIYLENINGVPELSNRWARVEYIDADHYSLTEESDNPIDSTGYGTFIIGPGAQSRRAYKFLVGEYAEADLPAIRYKQSADVLFLTHRGYPSIKITRTADTNWTAEAIEFGVTMDRPISGAGTGDPAGSDDVRYRITAVSEDTFEESFAGFGNALTFAGISKGGGSPVSITTSANHNYVTGETVYFHDMATAGTTFLDGQYYTITVTGLATFTLDGTTLGGPLISYIAPAGEVEHDHILVRSITYPTAADPVTLTWDAVPGALEYNVYREIGGVYARIYTTPATTLVDEGFALDLSSTPPVDAPVFAAVGDYPHACGFYQQSLMLAGAINDPEAIRKSKAGLYYNFTQSHPIQDDDAFRFIIASGQVNAVRHFLDMGTLLVFTQGAVHSINGNVDGTLVPSSPNPKLRAEYGIGDLAPMAVGDVALFVQSSRKTVREMLPEPGSDRYQANDLTIFSKHLFKRYQLTSWTYAEEPVSTVWATRNDGTLLGCTYVKKHEILGWHRHDTGDGDVVLDVCCIPENGESSLYLAVRRYDCNGRTRVYLERMASRSAIETADDGRFFDSHAVYDGRNTDEGNTYELHLDTTYESPLDYWIAPTGGTDPFEEGVDSSDIGNAIVLTLADGSLLWCTIAEVYNQFAARVTIEGTPPALPYETSSWAYAVDELAGFWHLEGRDVRAIGDNGAVGPFTVTNGKVSLGEAYMRVTGGLRIDARGVTLRPDNPDPSGPSWAGRTKTMGQVVAMVTDTYGLEIATGPILGEFSFQPFNTKQCADGKPDDGALYTGTLVVSGSGKRSYKGQVSFRQWDGYPSTVLGLYPTIDVGGT